MQHHLAYQDRGYGGAFPQDQGYAAIVSHDMGYAAIQQQQQQQQQQPQQQPHHHQIQAHGNLHRGGYQQAPAFREALYTQLLPVVRQVLEIALENEFEESTHAVTTFVMDFRFPRDGSGIEQWMPPSQSQDVLKGRILEALAHWVRARCKQLDYMVQSAQVCHHFFADRVQACKRQLEQTSDQSSYQEVFAEFIHTIVVEVLGKDSACLGSLLGGMLLTQSNRSALLIMTELPSTLMALMVRNLVELQAKISKVVMEMYAVAGLLSYDDSKNQLTTFFQHFAVETNTGTLEVHETCFDQAFVQSQFRVNLIDSFGCLLQLLRHLELICHIGPNAHVRTGEEVVLAVDFEGAKLCRHGPLCLVQMTCSDDPTLVNVLDVHVLGRRAFTMQTPHGTSMTSVLEDPNIRKIWFDPRNDVDALYHQFGIMPHGIFDLQLAEVADRRNRGLNVHYVQGLYKCLIQCQALHPEQKIFAERINNLGKSLFEPQNGGRYEIFQVRPLNPVILVYSAHDSRYLLPLYEQYVSSLGPAWVQRVLRESEKRGRWCLSHDYVEPSVAAPDF